MSNKRLKSVAAFTLVEIMLSVAVLLIALIGTAGYRYQSALDSQKSRLHINAARVGLSLSESWRGLKGSQSYDPAVHLGSDLSIAENVPLEAAWGTSVGVTASTEGFQLLGVYTITSDGVDYHAILSWKDVSTGLRALSIVVTWPEANRMPISSISTYKVFKTTAYTET